MATDHELILAIKRMDREYARRARLSSVADDYYRLWRQVKDHPHGGHPRLREIYFELVVKMTRKLIDDPGLCSHTQRMREWGEYAERVLEREGGEP